MTASEEGNRRRPLKLVPRQKEPHSTAAMQARRAWLEREQGCSLAHVGATSLAAEDMRGNIENPIGAAQVPLAVVGPLLVNGDHARGTFYVPMATSEGALVSSYERGAVALTRAGGVTTVVQRDENRMAPAFFFDDVAQASAFAARIPDWFDSIREMASATTRHGRLLKLTPHVVGRQVIVDFCFATGDAHGMNMIGRATEPACRWLAEQGGARRFDLFSGHGLEKRAGASLFFHGKGKAVVAGALIPARVASAYLHATPAQLHGLCHHTMIGHFHAGSAGFNAQLANGLAGCFIACGQDVANLANSAVGITNMSLTESGDLYASVTLPSLTVATVGGGVNLGTSRECLQLMDCYGPGKARKLAEIIAAFLLAGELSISAAIVSGEFVAAHENLGRNRPND